MLRDSLAATQLVQHHLGESAGKQELETSRMRGVTLDFLGGSIVVQFDRKPLGVDCVEGSRHSYAITGRPKKCQRTLLEL